MTQNTDSLALPAGTVGIIFDCDGVLIDSRVANMLYYNRIRESAGFGPMSVEEENYAQMHSARESLAHIFPPAMHARLAQLAGAVNYKREIMPHIRHMPGLHNCLELLAKSGLRLGVLTNRGRRGMELVIDRFGLHDCFDPVLTAEDVKGKPAPDGLLRTAALWGCAPDELVFVGDSLLDAQSAEAAGSYFFAYDNRELRAHGHLDSFAQLEKLAKPTM